jgi:four helix bundle protein
MESEPRRLADQLFRAGTSVGANYRAADRRRSRAEFIAKIGIAIEECDESAYWMELAAAAGYKSGKESTRLLGEADELIRIFVASVVTAKANARRQC